MDNAYLMYAAMCLFMISYVPFILVEYKHRHMYAIYIRNIPERLVICSAMILGFTYSVRTNNMTLIVCYSPQLCLEICVLMAKFWYCIVIHNCLPSQEIKEDKPYVESLRTSGRFVDNGKIEIIVDTVSPLFD